MSRVLVVEDDPIIAFDLVQQLSDAGFSVIGPARSAQQGLDLVTNDGCTLAVLDVHLGRETSKAVAETLVQRGVPFVTLSGYASDQHPPALGRGMPLMKPVRFDQLRAALETLGPRADEKGG